MSTRYITLSCFVPGVPCPKGSWRIAGKRLIPDNKGEKLWADSVGWGVKIHRPELVKKPYDVTVRLVFCMPKPQKAKNPFPVGDVDKLTRSVLDALTGIAYQDDVQVTRVEASKQYLPAGGDPGVHIEIETALGAA